MRFPYALLALATLTLAACATDPSSAVAPLDQPTRGAVAALAGTGPVTVVTDDHVARQPENTAPTASWVLYTRTAASTGTFRVGPGTAAELGVGSLELTTPTGADKVFLFNYDHVGARLDAIDALAYSTHRAAGSLQQVSALNVQVDVNGPAEGGFTTLVFEPVYNTAQGAVQDGVWQRWDAYAGGAARWWSTRAIPGACAFDCFVAWSAIVAANPDAVVVGGLGVNQGSGNGGLTAAVDALVLGVGGATITYDFEPYVTAATREACKDDGWRTARRADGSAFRNQGDCVSYVSGRS